MLEVKNIAICCGNLKNRDLSRKSPNILACRGNYKISRFRESAPIVTNICPCGVKQQYSGCIVADHCPVAGHSPLPVHGLSQFAALKWPYSGRLLAVLWPCKDRILAKLWPYRGCMKAIDNLPISHSWQWCEWMLTQWLVIILLQGTKRKKKSQLGRKYKSTEKSKKERVAINTDENFEYQSFSDTGKPYSIIDVLIHCQLWLLEFSCC